MAILSIGSKYITCHLQSSFMVLIVKSLIIKTMQETAEDIWAKNIERLSAKELPIWVPDF